MTDTKPEHGVCCNLNTGEGPDCNCGLPSQSLVEKLHGCCPYSHSGSHIKVHGRWVFQDYECPSVIHALAEEIQREFNGLLKNHLMLCVGYEKLEARVEELEKP